jgi:hypothetical protein
MFALKLGKNYTIPESSLNFGSISNPFRGSEIYKNFPG